MEEFYPYPVFLILKNKLCVIIGGGDVAFRKACEIIETGAFVKVIAPKSLDSFQSLEETGRIEIIKKYFEPNDVDGAFIVFAATNDESVNGKISRIARSKGILVNVVDDPAKCDFFSGAIVKRGPLRIAVSTSGYSPFLAAEIKKNIEKDYDNSYGDYIYAAGEIRKRLIGLEKVGKEDKKKAIEFLSGADAFGFFKQYGKERLWEELTKIISI